LPTPDFGEAFQLRKEGTYQEGALRFIIIIIVVVHGFSLLFSDGREGVEAWANEMLGPISGNEYDLPLSKLGGTRRNQV
jgi:hypothetical protein